MDKDFAEKYLALCEAAMEDEPYRALLEELREADARLPQALKERAPRHREAVEDYLGIVHEANRRLLMFALRSDEKS